MPTDEETIRLQDAQITRLMEEQSAKVTEARAARRQAAASDLRAAVHEAFFVAVKTVLATDAPPAEQLARIRAVAGSNDPLQKLLSSAP